MVYRLLRSCLAIAQCNKVIAVGGPREFFCNLRSGRALAEDRMAQRLYDAVDRERLNDHLMAFSRWMKEAGTPSEMESLAYVRSVLDGYGYRTYLILHD